MEKVIIALKKVPLGVWIVAGLIILSIVFRSMFSLKKYFKKLFDSWGFGSPTDDEVSNSESYVDNLPSVDYNNVNLSDSQISQYVSKLYVALNGMGTDSQAIFDVLDSVSKDELILIISSFDLKEDTNLVEWLKSELSDYSIPFISENEYQKAKLIFEGHGLVF